MNSDTVALSVSILVISRTHQNISRLLGAINQAAIPVPYEVLCSWNGPVGDEHQIVVPSGVPFRIIEQRPYNFAKNNNGLARHAVGAYILFINDDVIPDKNAITNALQAIQDPCVGIVGANLRYVDDRLQHAGVFFKEDGTPFHRLKHQVRWDDPALSFSRFVPCVTGAFVLIRREEFFQLLFDEAFRVCGEDIALNLSYRAKFKREILYLASATAVHIENETRKQVHETKTPAEDMGRILSYSQPNGGVGLTVPAPIRVRIITEKPGWIMHRKAEEIAKNLSSGSVVINEDMHNPDINYYINYGYFNRRPVGGLTLANFTHYDPDNLADKFVSVAREVDHCVAVSEQTAEILRGFGIPDSKITTIIVGADKRFRPELTLGIVGRVYPGGRKGEDLVRRLLDDAEVNENVRVVALKEGWGAPVWAFDDEADFYRAIDYLLIPSRIEGGPVPFMEALACGTMSIAPNIGVISQFPHLEYPVGDYDALKRILMETAHHHLVQRDFLFKSIRSHNWETWAFEHERLFRRLLLHETARTNSPSQYSSARRTI